MLSSILLRDRSTMSGRALTISLVSMSFTEGLTPLSPRLLVCFGSVLDRRERFSVQSLA
jgi:hypothetical protein